MKILITGAGRGIGLACVKQLAQNNSHTIIAVSRNTKAIEALGKPNIHIIPADITHTEKVDDFVQAITSLYGKIDILINNAGLLINKPFTAFSAEDARRIFELNFFAPARLIEVLVPHFNPGSHIVNIGSMGGYQGSAKFKGLAYYSASKAALANLAECLAEELKDKEIRVNCLALGAVQTEMLQEAFPGYQSPVSAADMAAYICDFALNGHKLFNGKVIPVSVSTP